MPKKRDADATHGNKLLRLYLRLFKEQRPHFQSELADWLNCSPQTVMRLIGDIEGVIGAELVCGHEGKRRTYQIKSNNLGEVGK